MTIPKWTEERTQQLENSVGDEDPISKVSVARLAEELGTSTRSVSSKLRKLGYAVETAAAAPKAFSDDEEEELRAFVEENEGQLTYAEIAAQFADGKFSPKAIQGKILSMELTGSVKPTPKPESTKTYTDEEEARVLELIETNTFVEDIAAELGKTVASIRGKALSLLRNGQISAMPKQREVKGQAPDALVALGDVSALKVSEIAEKVGKTERGIKTMLTRRGIKAADYDGAAKQAKKAAE